jgi:hypothetical protein
MTGWKLWAGLVALLAAVTGIVTYPQITHMSSAVHDFGDPLLNAWALAWTPHALVTQPASLFDANIFHPERATLALSEVLLLPALMAAPFYAAGANAILLHNLTLLSACVLSGVTMFLLVRSLTGDGRAALLAAVAFTASPLRIEHYPRVQLQLTYLMPLALYFVHRIIDGDERKRTTVLAGATCGLLFYSCIYYLSFFLTLLPILVGLCLAVRRTNAMAIAGRLGIASVVMVALVAPGAAPYLHNRGNVGERHVDELRPGSAELRDYRRANSTNWLYGDRQRVGPAERHLFTGYVLPAAAAGAIASPVGRWLPYAASLAAAVELSLGVNGHAYRWLYAYVVPYRALRVPARFAMLAHLLLAVLAGLGAAAFMRRMPSPVLKNVAIAALLAGVLVESLNRPVTLRAMPRGIPAVYEWLREQPAGPILEYPVNGLEGRGGPQDATYMYYSTAHWRPLLNGYSGFSPASYHAVLHYLRDFPDPGSLAYLKERGVKYLLVHEAFYLRGGFEADVDTLARSTQVTVAGIFRDPVLGRTYVYELVR